MKHSLSKYLAAFAAVTMVLSPALAFATDAGANPSVARDYNVAAACPQGATCLVNTFDNGAQDVVTLVKTITNWLFTFLLLMAVIFFVMAGYKYLTSGGGEEVSSAHKMVVYGAVAVAVGALAQGISFVVQKLVGAQ